MYVSTVYGYQSCPYLFIFLPCPRSRLRNRFCETRSAVLSRISPLILHTQTEFGAYLRALLLPPAFRDIHYTICTIHYTLYTTHYALHTIHYTLHFTLYTLHFTLYIYTLHFTLYTIHYDGVHLSCQPPLSQSRVYRVTRLPTEGVYRRESAGTG